MFYCAAERVAKNCTKIKTVAAAVCCAKHAEIISLWRFLLHHRHYASSVHWLATGALLFASTSNYKKKRSFDLSLTAFGQHSLHLRQRIELK